MGGGECMVIDSDLKTGIHPHWYTPLFPEKSGIHRPSVYHYTGMSITMGEWPPLRFERFGQWGGSLSCKSTDLRQSFAVRMPTSSPQFGTPWTSRSGRSKLSHNASFRTPHPPKLKRVEMYLCLDSRTSNVFFISLKIFLVDLKKYWDISEIFFETRYFAYPPLLIFITP